MVTSSVGCSQLASKKIYEAAERDAIEIRQELQMTIQSPEMSEEAKAKILSDLLVRAEDRRDKYFQEYLKEDEESKNMLWEVAKTIGLFSFHVVIVAVALL